MLGRQETSSQIGKISVSGIGMPLQVRSQMQVGVICVINDDVTFDDFATPACNEAMNAAVLQSEWKIDTPVWDEAPSTSSGYRGPASTEMRSQHFVCPTCSKSFAWKNSLTKHMKTHTGENLFRCRICDKVFGRNDSLKRHMRIHASEIGDETIAPKANLNQDVEIHSKENDFECDICNETFGRKDNLIRHMKTHSKENDFKCDICDRSFQRKHCFAMHMQKHQEKKYDSRKCDRSFISLHHLNQHVRASHPEIKLTSVKRGAASTPEGNSKRVRREGGALNTFASTFFQPTENSKKDFLLFFDEITPQLKEKIEEEIQEKGAVKWYGVVKAVFKRESEDGGEERVTPYFRSNVQIELVGDTIGAHVPVSFSKILEAVDEFIRRGSGWILDKIVHFELCVAEYHPLRASSYIILPKKLVDKKAVLNIQNEDQKCLVWCLIAHKLNILAHDSFRVSHYTLHEQEIKLDGVECPVPLNKIPIVERLNNLRINVFGYEENAVFPLYVSKRVDEECVNLLLIANEETQHYCLIRNMSRLLGDLTKHKTKHHYCYRCLHRFAKVEILKEHLQYCSEHSPQHIKMPEKGENFVKFQNVHYQHPLPYIIYADFESLIAKEVHTSGNTEIVARHEAC
ncbi:Zinc finger protein 287 [Araneus ventricosus]|uniref:Zinc finger protein 287 n=1 Tax=Araneus ventricosus TaxID=182803 RepID=A0A4Y2G1H3_ARAVE|nr:Zinc finger protein 287 [Araneus ventricosus]